MLNIKNTVKFKKDLKKFKHQQTVLKELNDVLKVLKNQVPLDQKYHDHPLTGNWIGHRECHIKPDILLIYKISLDTLFLERLGSHAELFN
jgi:mRNA interferase YafQ